MDDKVEKRIEFKKNFMKDYIKPYMTQYIANSETIHCEDCEHHTRNTEITDT